MLLIALFLNLHSAPSFAEIKSCICSIQSDIRMSQNCGPKPFKVADPLTPSCETTSDPNVSWLNQFVSSIKKFFSNEVKSILLNKPNPIMKDSVGLLSYFNCYRDSPDRFCHFRNTILPFLELSSSSARLPIAVQACLFKRESQYDPKAISSTSAKGYIQFMPGTFRDLNQGIINISVPDMMKALQENRDQLANNPNLTEKDKNYLLTRIQVQTAKLRAKLVWDSYWMNTDRIPKEVNEKSASCPSVAFAMAATKQVYDLYLMKNVEIIDNENETPSVNGMNDFETAILLAGGYNCGVGEIAKECGTSTNLEDCMNVFKSRSEPAFRKLIELEDKLKEALAKQKPNSVITKIKHEITRAKSVYYQKNETYGHMSSIKNCSEKNVWEPMSGHLKRDCQPYQCKELSNESEN